MSGVINHDVACHVLTQRIARYLIEANPGKGRLTDAYARTLAKGILDRITLNDLDYLKELFP